MVEQYDVQTDAGELIREKHFKCSCFSQVSYNDNVHTKQNSVKYGAVAVESINTALTPASLQEGMG